MSKRYLNLIRFISFLTIFLLILFGKTDAQIQKQIRFNKVGNIYITSELGNCVGTLDLTLVPDKNKLYLSNIETSNIGVVDLNQRKMVNIIKIPGKQERHTEITYNSFNGKVYMTSSLQNGIYAVDPEEERVIKFIKTDISPTAIAIEPEKGYICISDFGGNEVIILDKDEKLLKKINVGSSPWGMAFNPRENEFYVVTQGNYPSGHLAQFPSLIANNDESPSLVVIDIDDFSIKKRIPTQKSPVYAAYNSNNGCVYISNIDQTLCFSELPEDYGNITVVDVDKEKVVKNIEVMRNPYSVTYDPDYNRIYAVSRMGELTEEVGQPGMISVIDANSNEVIKNVPTGHLAHFLQINPEKNEIYVSSWDNQEIWIYDREEFSKKFVLNGFGTTIDDIKANGSTKKVYVVGHLTGKVTVADAVPLKKIRNIRIGRGWSTGIGINYKTNLIYITNVDEGTVSVIDGNTDEVIEEINLGIGINRVRRLWSSVAIDEKRNLIYVTLCRMNGIAVIDGKRNIVIKRIILGKYIPDDYRLIRGVSVFEIDVDSDRNLVYTFNPFDLMLSVIDGEKQEIKTQTSLKNLDLPLSRSFSPFNRLAVDSETNRIYLCNWIMDGKTNKIIGKLPVDRAGGVVTVDNDEHKLYVHGIGGLTVLDSKNYDKLGRLEIFSDSNKDSELRILFGIDTNSNRVYTVKDIMEDGNRLLVYDEQ